MHVDSNQTITTEFVFRPFSSVPTTRWLLFVLFFLLYLAIVVGNTSIVWVVHTDHALQSPMYFFLGNLALLEVCYTTTVVPQMLASILDPCTTISLTGCGTQMFLFLGLGGTDCFLLAIMAYDRYVAICQPLRYPLIMTQKLCLRLVIAALSLAFLLSLELTALIFAMPFCRRQINHFLCDVPPMLGLACADIHIHQTVLFTVSVTILTVPFLLICLSYGFIGITILRIRSAQGRHQAFSTCTSHLTVVLLQYGCCSLVYLRPKSKSSEDEVRQLALIYTFATPMLNPLIYSLRNKDIKGALRRAFRCTITSQPH